MYSFLQRPFIKHTVLVWTMSKVWYSNVHQIHGQFCFIRRSVKTAVNSVGKTSTSLVYFLFVRVAEAGLFSMFLEALALTQWVGQSVTLSDFYSSSPHIFERRDQQQLSNNLALWFHFYAFVEVWGGWGLYFPKIVDKLFGPFLDNWVFSWCRRPPSVPFLFCASGLRNLTANLARLVESTKGFTVASV